MMTAKEEVQIMMFCRAGFDDHKVYGNSGDDNLQGGPGLDQLYGDSGDDRIWRI